MNRTFIRALVPGSVVLAALAAPVAPASADPAASVGLQTSVCDNGQTYVFSLRDRGAEQAFGHAPIHDPASNAVLIPISGSGNVTISDGETVESFPFSYGRPRSQSSGHVTTCQSTYDQFNGPVHVHVESVDVLLVSGAR